MKLPSGIAGVAETGDNGISSLNDSSDGYSNIVVASSLNWILNWNKKKIHKN